MGWIWFEPQVAGSRTEEAWALDFTSKQLNGQKIRAIRFYLIWMALIFAVLDCPMDVTSTFLDYENCFYSFLVVCTFLSLDYRVNRQVLGGPSSLSVDLFDNGIITDKNIYVNNKSIYN